MGDILKEHIKGGGKNEKENYYFIAGDGIVYEHDEIVFMK